MTLVLYFFLVTQWGPNFRHPSFRNNNLRGGMCGLQLFLFSNPFHYLFSMSLKYCHFTVPYLWHPSFIIVFYSVFVRNIGWYISILCYTIIFIIIVINILQLLTFYYSFIIKYLGVCLLILLITWPKLWELI